MGQGERLGKAWEMQVRRAARGVDSRRETEGDVPLTLRHPGASSSCCPGSRQV